MPAIMSLEEPRPRGTVLGERAHRRRVSEAENFFRCNICGGYLDARDYVWVRITKARCRTRRKIACSSSKQSGGTSLKSIFMYRSWNDCRVPA
jgi:hypothetical protein